MEIEKDDKEKEAPANVEEKKPTEITPDAFQKLQETVENLNKRLEDKELQASQLTEKLRLSREANKPLIIAPPVTLKNTDDDDSEPDEVDVKINTKLSEEKKQEYINRVNRCFNKFSIKSEELLCLAASSISS